MPLLFATHSRWSKALRPLWTALASSSAPTSRSGRSRDTYRAPFTTTSPDVGASSPRIMRMVVDLPAPFGPRNPVTCPGMTWKDIRSTARVDPYRLVSSRASINVAPKISDASCQQAAKAGQACGGRVHIVLAGRADHIALWARIWHYPGKKRSGGAYHRRVGLWPEPSWSSCRARCAVGVPAGTGDDPYRHRAEHALHAGTHMANSHRVYLVVPQEPCHTGVMGTFGPLVVQRSPGNGELLPVADLLAGHVGDRDPVGSSPARVDLAIICDWHAYPHVESLLAGARKFWAPLGSPVLDQTRRDSLRNRW